MIPMIPITPHPNNFHDFHDSHDFHDRHGTHDFASAQRTWHIAMRYVQLPEYYNISTLNFVWQKRKDLIDKFLFRKAEGFFYAVESDEGSMHQRKSRSCG